MVISISGKSGCGNTTVSKLLAKKTGFKHINYTFKQMASSLGLTVEELAVRSREDSRYDLELDRHQVSLASTEDSVLASRLAVWLTKENSFRVYLDASLEIRAERIARREEKDLAVAIAETRKRDNQDGLRFQKLYNIDFDDFGFCDLVIDVSSKSPEQITDEIIREARRTGVLAGSSM